MSSDRPFELLAPGGDIECIKAAIVAGADAVYCGLNTFNARNRAANTALEQLPGIVRLAHGHHCRIFLTLNIIIVEQEIPALIRLLNKIVNISIDAVIVQDLGLLYLLKTYFPSIAVHASTQLTTHNGGQIEFLRRFDVARVNLCRELSLAEIEPLTAVAHGHDMLVEVFVHGSYCLGFSGLCYMSSVKNGNSGNRGRCSQPCRSQYQTTPMGRAFPLNLKDNAAFCHVNRLRDAGVDSIKIEGRIKKSHYVYTVVQSYCQQIHASFTHKTIPDDLYTVFNRDFSDGFLQGNIGADLCIDNPMDHSALHFSRQNGLSLEEAKRLLYAAKTEIIGTVREQIASLSIEKEPLTLTLSGRIGSPLKIKIEALDLHEVVESDANLVVKSQSTNRYELNEAVFFKRFKKLTDSAYYLDQIDLAELEQGLFIPFRALTELARKIRALLHGAGGWIPPIEVPVLEDAKEMVADPCLAILIDSPDDLVLCDGRDIRVYYQIPGCLQGKVDSLVELFSHNSGLIPWFQTILIGEDLQFALEFLKRLRPECIVTNNTGIAHGAAQLGLSWIAGPYLNTVNSLALLALQEDRLCKGAFISSEINRRQIQTIKRPEGFELYYSLYHPLLLMMSRHCLLQSVVGCNQERIDGACLRSCQQRASIDTLEHRRLYLEKSKGNYHCLYHDRNFLNLDIVQDSPRKFTGLLVDLRDVPTGTVVTTDKAELVDLFQRHLSGDGEASARLEVVISKTTCRQYEKGI